MCAMHSLELMCLQYVNCHSHALPKFYHTNHKTTMSLFESLRCRSPIYRFHNKISIIVDKSLLFIIIHVGIDYFGSHTCCSMGIGKHSKYTITILYIQ